MQVISKETLKSGFISLFKISQDTMQYLLQEKYQTLYLFFCNEPTLNIRNVYR